jgi:tRNA pseudouridine55 synthase
MYTQDKKVSPSKKVTMEETKLNGILILDKPKGITSHDVVDIVRRLFKIKKVGHAGTLDPIATGVLVVLIGRATKKSDLLASSDKEYEARLRLGVTTDTGDAFGKAIGTSQLQGLDSELVEKAIMGFKGEIEQMPPMFSAVKFKGKRLYKWARKGITVPRKARKVTIRNICIKEISLPDIVFDVSCSKGTYIRQLCMDIGGKLGCGAHMAELRRLRAGDFHISQAIDIDRLKGLPEKELYNALIRL